MKTFVLSFIFTMWLTLIHQPCAASKLTKVHYSKVNNQTLVLSNSQSQTLPTPRHIKGRMVYCQKEYEIGNTQSTDIREAFSKESNQSYKSISTQNPNDCKPKLKIEVAIIHGKKDTPEQLILQSVYDEQTKTEVKLYSPLFVSVNQEPLLISYPFSHSFSVNNMPFEAILHNNMSCGLDGNTLTGCKHEHHPASKEHSPEHKAGFCCSCQGVGLKNNSRAAQNCEGNHADMSSHCLRFDSLWYSVNTLGDWSMYERLNIGVSSDTDAGWVKFTGDTPLHVGTGVPSASTPDKKITAVYTRAPDSDVSPPLDQHDEVLLIPEPLSTSTDSHELTEQLKGGPGEYLVLAKTAVDQTGTTCNKVGVSYPAFLHQQDRCMLTAQSSCFTNQPHSYWLRDKETQRANISDSRLYWLEGRASLARHPVVQTSTSPRRLQLVYSGPYSSRVNLTIDSEMVTLLRQGVEGAVISSTSHSSDRDTTITAQVFNPALVGGVYHVKVSGCTPFTLQDSAARRVSLPPHRSTHVTFTFPPVNCTTAGSKGSCSLQLSSHTGKVVAKRRVTVHRLDNCYCVGYCVCRCGHDRSQLCQPLSQTEYTEEGLPGRVPSQRTLPHMTLNADHFIEVVVYIVLILLLLGLIKVLLGAFVSVYVGQFGLGFLRDPRYRDESKRQMSLQREMALNVFFFFYLMILPLHAALAMCVERRVKSAYQQVQTCEEMTSSPEKTAMFGKEKAECPRCSPRQHQRAAETPTTSAMCSTLDREAAIERFRKQKKAIQKFKLEKKSWGQKLMEELQQRSDHKVKSVPNQTETGAANDGELDNPTPQDQASRTTINEVHVNSDFLRDLTAEQRAFIERITLGGVRIFLTYLHPDIHLRRPGAQFCLCGHVRQVDHAYKFSLGPNISQFYEVVDDVKQTLLTPLPINPKFFQQTLRLSEVLTYVTEAPTGPCLNYVWDDKVDHK